MIVFREHTPKRQNITKSVSKHQDHRADLKKDFWNRCGYCNDIKLGIAEFEIDHFVPQKPKDFTTTLSPTLYSNLIFSCKSCNRAKGNKWPTNDEQIHNLNDEGFIDPCDEKYNNQFDRNEKGRIIHKTDLGEWMYYALKLHKPQHEIIWNIDQLDLMTKEIKQLQMTNYNDIDLIADLIKVYDDFHKYLYQLSEI